MNSLERRVKAQERRLLPPSGRELLIVTPEEYDAMVRDACERVLASLPDERTRALVDAVLGAKHRALVQKAFHELNLPLRPTNYREWPPGTRSGSLLLRVRRPASRSGLRSSPRSGGG